MDDGVELRPAGVGTRGVGVRGRAGMRGGVAGRRVMAGWMGGVVGYGVVGGAADGVELVDLISRRCLGLCGRDMEVMRVRLRGYEGSAAP